jgi:hypothetical protein
MKNSKGKKNIKEHTTTIAFLDISLTQILYAAVSPHPSCTLSPSYDSWFQNPNFDYVGHEVLTAVIMNSSVFWNMTAYSSMRVNTRFGGTCRLHLQGWIVSHARNQYEGMRKQQGEPLLLPASRLFLALLTLQPCRWKRHVPAICRLIFNGLYGVISHKTELFRRY